MAKTKEEKIDNFSIAFLWYKRLIYNSVLACMHVLELREK